MDGKNTLYWPSGTEPGGHSDTTDNLAVRCDGGVDVTSHSSEGADECHVRVEHLGGITSIDLRIPSGISILVGRNATNRSSFLRSLGAGLGGQESAARLKTDRETGSVQLDVGTDTYTREYRRNETTQTPYTDDSTIVDTFVALFADSPARRAVERGESLRDTLMKPVDTAEIQSRVAELKRERSELDETIQRAEVRKKKLPALEEDRTRLETELTSVENEIADLEAVVEEIEAQGDGPDETEQLRSELESLRTELRSAERRSDDTDQQLEFRRTERAQLVEQRDELADKLEAFEDPETLETKIADRTSEIEQLTEQRTNLQQAVEDLQSVIQANETFLDGDIELVGLTNEESVTDALDPESQTVECWTCGTEVGRGVVGDRIETLRDIATKQRTEIQRIDDRLSELKKRQATDKQTLDEYNEKTRTRAELDNRISQHSDKIEQLEAEYEDQQAEIERLDEAIAAIEADIEETETADTDGSDRFIAVHKELTELERERGRVENQLEDVNEKIEEIEALEDDRIDAETRRGELLDELEELRGRIDQLETDLVETLNSIMDDLLDRLAYENIARVWLERKTTDGTTGSSFELHIVRETEDGSVYEDTVETLSESEREIIGVIVALAGYLVHDIDREVPFLLLDSVEMIDGERLAHLLDYIQTETNVQFLCVALLPKDAQSVERTNVLDEYTTIDFESVSP